MSNSIGNSPDRIRICPLEESGFSVEELHTFIIRVFQERLAQGLNFKVANSTYEGFVEYLKKNDSHVFVALDEGLRTLVGTSTIIIRSRKGVLYGHHGLWAVSEQGLGIGSRLVKEEIKYAKSRGIRYVESDTAEGAVSSVRAHLKCGFVKSGYYSFPFTNYFSIYFRLQCSRSSFKRFVSHHLVYPLRYCLYYTYTRITRKSDGTDTSIVLLLKKVLPN